MDEPASQVDERAPASWAEIDPARRADQTIQPSADDKQRLSHASLVDGLRQLGYEIGSELGRGGLGVVHVATQQVFDRQVAVKRLLGGTGNHKAALRFFAEALITAQLEHPHIVPIHDLLTDGDGQLRLVMKRVEGNTWHHLLYTEDHPEPAGTAEFTLDDHLGILLKVCDALSFAHERGILHRDLKPENVMVGAYGEVLVMDWGCAVAFGAHEHHPAIPRVDDITMIAGTPAYLPPEMAMVRREAMGPHSDVYLLGAVLYEMLTHQRPHRGERIQAVLRDSAFGTIVPPAAAAPERDIPDELSSITMAALAKDPAARIATVAEFAHRLRDYRLHAQAVSLTAVAREHLTAATTDRRNADELLRQAVSAAEQARRIWPTWPRAGQVLLNARLAWAEHHLAGGAAGLSAAQATKAATLAQELGRSDQVNQSRTLAAKARAAVQNHEQRQRQLRIARIGTIAASVLLIVALGAFLVLVSSEQRRTATALAKAEQALDALTREQTARGDDQKTSAPALVAQARKAMEQRLWDEALTSLRIAVGFDPGLVEAHRLITNILAAAGKLDEVASAGERWQQAAGGDATAGRLIAVCRELASTTDPAARMPKKVLLGELFEQQHLYVLAETVAIPGPERLELYRKRLEQTWPGIGPGIHLARDGHSLVANPFSWSSPSFGQREDVIDLEPLRGLAFSNLDLTRTKVRDLTPLAAMPLNSLTITGTPVSTLVPLRGLPLRILSLNDTRVTDLSPLAGMPLDHLNVGGIAINSLESLRGMRLTSLMVYNTRISDLSPIAGMPLNRLLASNTSITDLTPITGMPLTELHLHDCKIRDLRPLVGAPLISLRVGNDVIDLTPLRGMPLKHLDAFGPSGFDLTPIANAPMEELGLGNSGMVDLASVPRTVRRLALHGITLSDATTLSRLQLTRLRLWHYHGARRFDLAVIDGSRLQRLEVSFSNGLDFSRLTASALNELVIDSCMNFDLAPLAASPLKQLTLSGSVDQPTWRSLAALRTCATLTTIQRHGETKPAAEFWKAYDPEKPR